MAPEFAIVPGTAVRAVLGGRHQQVVDTIRQAYITHDAGLSTNPPSCFLRFPDRPDARIIALPASLGGEFGVDGVKWVSSYPGNTRKGLPRASAVLILNDVTTGYPVACLEGSMISAARTAASAVLAAGELCRGRQRPATVAYLGTGLIAGHVHEYFVETGWTFESVHLFDAEPERAARFHSYLVGSGDVTIHDAPEKAVRAADLVVFATTMATPHVVDFDWFAHNPVVLHISLRDLSAGIIARSANVLDDVEHCLRENTSVHLAEQATGSRRFVTGTLCDLIHGRVSLPADRPVVFSPFGLGVLDLALGRFVLDEAAKSGRLRPIDGFFAG